MNARAGTDAATIITSSDVPAFVGRANELLPSSDSTHLQIRALDQLTRR
jgi:hypothetical protein